MRNCNGCCVFCPNPCTKGAIRGNQEKISPISVPSITPEEEKGASDAFDSAEVTVNEPEETGLAVVENIGSYEVKKNIFGKEYIKKVK